MSQANDILAHLEKVGPITPIQALESYGCFRLAARIAELREAGHKILTFELRLSNGKKVAEYRLWRSAA